MRENNTERLDPEIEEIMGHLPAEERIEMAHQLRQWALQLWLSATSEPQVEIELIPPTRQSLN